MATDEMDRAEYLYMAMIAENAGRYNDVAKYMKGIVDLKVDLTEVERSYFALGYKHLVDASRSSWRVLSYQEWRSAGNEGRVARVRAYRELVEKELTEICNEVLRALKTRRIPSAESTQSTLFYCRMKGDHYRFLAEFKTGEEREDAATGSLDAYQSALDIADTCQLPQTHPLRLGVTLNLSVLLYEILPQRQRGLAMARSALVEAMRGLDGLDENTKRQCNLFIDILKENITNWTSELEQEERNGEQIGGVIHDCYSSCAIG